MKTTWKTSYAICNPTDPFSFNYTCSGPSCSILSDLFAETTCNTQGDTLSCTNGLSCKDTPDYLFVTEWSGDDTGEFIKKTVTSPECGYTLVSSSFGQNSSVVLVNDTCTWSPDTGTVNNTTTSIPGLSSGTTFITSQKASEVVTPPSLGSTTSPQTSNLNQSSSIASDAKSVTIAGLPSETASTAPLPTQTTSEPQNSVNTGVGQTSILSSALLTNVPSTSSSVAQSSSLVTSSSSSPQFTGSASHPRINCRLLFVVLTLGFLLLCPGVSATPRPFQENEDNRCQSHHPTQALSILQPRVDPTTIDWTVLAKKEDIDLFQLAKFLDAVQKIAVRKAADGLSSGTWWIHRRDWREAIRVNVLDNVCKQLFSAGLGPAQNKLYKDYIYKGFQRAATRGLMERFTSSQTDPKTTVLAGFLAGFSVDTGITVSHKKLPIVGSIGSLICQPQCNDNSDARLTDPNNCGFCGVKCTSGECTDGLCVTRSCSRTGESSTFNPCGLGPNAATCTCASDLWGTGFCVQYASSALDLTGDTCEFNDECAKGKACVTLPSGSRKVCLDASSCLTDRAPDVTEPVPHFSVPAPEATHKPWILHIRTPTSQSEEGAKLAYSENPALLNNLDPNLLVKNSKGQTTTNTQCVNVIKTANQQASMNLPGFLGGLGGTLPKGFPVYFGYDVEEFLNGAVGDSCCITVYGNDDCTGNSQPNGGGPCISQWIDNLGIDVQSFKVSGCQGLL